MLWNWLHRHLYVWSPQYQWSGHTDGELHVQKTWHTRQYNINIRDINPSLPASRWRWTWWIIQKLLFRILMSWSFTNISLLIYGTTVSKAVISVKKMTKVSNKRDATYQNRWWYSSASRLWVIRTFTFQANPHFIHIFVALLKHLPHISFVILFGRKGANQRENVVSAHEHSVWSI